MLLVLIFAGFSLACASEETNLVAMRDSPSTKIVAASSNLKVVVRIDTRVVGDHDPRLPMCAGTTHPCSGVERLRITVNGRPLFVPVSSFFDLADLRNGQITFSGGHANLLLNGGDASESYSVKIQFNASRVLSRAVFSVSTPEEPLQETIYHEVVLD